MKAKDFFPNTDYVTFSRSDLERAFEKAYRAGYTEANITSGKMVEVIFISRDKFDFGMENYIFSRGSGIVMFYDEEMAMKLYDFVTDIGLETKDYTFEELLGKEMANDFVDGRMAGHERTLIKDKFPEFVKKYEEKKNVR